MNREPHFDENEVLRQCMSPLNEEVPDMPENFHAQWTALVKEDAMKQEETRKVAPMRRWTRILSVAAALVFVVGGTLLTKDSLSPARTSAPQSLADSYDYDYDTYTSDVGYSEEAGSGVRTMMVGTANDAMPEAASAKSAVAEDKKIIRNVSLTIKTSAYDDSMASLTALLSQYGGYLESSSEYTNSRDLRTASLTLRIPADSLDAFLSNTGELGRITSRNMSSTDVTASYQDTAARLENQKLLLARLQALTDTAGDLSDLLALETQLADTQYNIEQLESDLADTDQQVNDATVRVTLNEEAQPDLRDETGVAGRSHPRRIVHRLECLRVVPAGLRGVPDGGAAVYRDCRRDGDCHHHHPQGEEAEVSFFPCSSGMLGQGFFLLAPLSSPQTIDIPGVFWYTVCKKGCGITQKEEDGTS